MCKRITSTVATKILQAITPYIIHVIEKKIFTKPLYLMLRIKILHIFLFHYLKRASKFEKFVY